MPFAEPAPVFVRAFEYPRGYPGHAHRHRLAQVVHPLRGVVSVTVDDRTWVVGPATAVTVPPWANHRVTAHGNVSLRSVFVDPDHYPGAVAGAGTCLVTPLARELIVGAGDRFPAPGRTVDELAARMVDLLVRLLPDLPAAPSTAVALPAVTDPVLRPAALGLLDDPGQATTVAGWADLVGLSERHFARLFKRHTGITFHQWRALVHVREALVRLTAGESVRRVAVDLGYSTPSAFIEMFKRCTGTTPGRLA